MKQQIPVWNEATDDAIADLDGPVVLVNDQYMSYVRPLAEGETLDEAVQEWVDGAHWGAEDEHEDDDVIYVSLGASIIDGDCHEQRQTANYLVTFGAGREKPEVRRTPFRETVSQDGLRLYGD